LPGVARRQLTFFVLPKKVSKERRAHYSGPLGCPRLYFALRRPKELAALKQLLAETPQHKAQKRRCRGLPLQQSASKVDLVIGVVVETHAQYP
jgi:hypothetical protein